MKYGMTGNDKEMNNSRDNWINLNNKLKNLVLYQNVDTNKSVVALVLIYVKIIREPFELCE